MGIFMRICLYLLGRFPRGRSNWTLLAVCIVCLTSGSVTESNCSAAESIAVHDSSDKARKVPAADVVKTVWRGKSGTLDVYDNSPSLSNILAVNSRGHVLGMHEQLDSRIAVLNQQFFFADSTTVRTIPKLKGFTNLYCESLSDNGRVVGYASRAPGNPDGTLTGFIWESSSGKIERLRPIAGDLVCHATDISGDGNRIVGYSTGNEPPKIRPCIWEWDEAASKWAVKPLPVLHDHNPYVVTGSVKISPNGKYIAACCTEKLLPNNVFDNALFKWKIDGDDAKRTTVSEMAARVDAVNDRGQIAGTITDATGRFPYVTETGDKLTKIELLDGDVQGQAHAIDSSGRVYGMSDDPPGPSGGPEAFLYEEG
ncbi:MAG TPA: hypothetical protein DDW52_05585, partial [Planctomycetaceae bacterium]|nr:hypothetical protein [Planctomycetaceae bacterium]